MPIFSFVNDCEHMIGQELSLAPRRKSQTFSLAEHVRVGEGLVITKTSEREGIEIGASVCLRPNLEQCHLFDATSGKNLSVQG